MAATQLELRQGNLAQILAFTGALGEPVYDTTRKQILIQDSATLGGIPVVSDAYVSNVASASTVDLASQAGNYIQITGTTSITSFGNTLGTENVGVEKTVVFTGALTLTYNAASLILPGNVNITTAAGDTAKFRYEGNGNWRCTNYTPRTGLPVIVQTIITQNYISGFTLSNDGSAPNTVLDIAAGYGADSTNVVMITGSAFTKSTAGTWAAGSGGNGMGTGLTIANSTWYHVFAIINASAYDVYFDTSVTAANKPAGTTAFRRIGSFKTDGSAHIIAFIQDREIFYWATMVADLSAVTLVAAATLYTLTVPTGVKVRPIIKATQTSSGGAPICYIASPDADHATAASVAVTDFNPNVNFNAQQSNAVSNQYTNTSAQIYVKASATTGTISINTQGWIDDRGMS